MYIYIYIYIYIKGVLEPVEGLRASDTSALCGACAGILGVRGLGLVVHFHLGFVSEINTP
jgi:hypothetical protein